MESVCRTAGSGPGGGSARPNNPSARSSRLFSESVCFLSLLSGSPSTGSRFQGAELEGGPGRVGTGPPHLPLPAGFPPSRLHPSGPCLGPTWTPHRPLSLSASLFRFLRSLETLQVGSLPHRPAGRDRSPVAAHPPPGDRSELQEVVCVAGSETSLGGCPPRAVGPLSTWPSYSRRLGPDQA